MEILINKKPPNASALVADQIGVSARQLRDVLYGPANRGLHYKRIEIPKNSSTPENPKIRVLHAVSNNLKVIQRSAYEYLSENYAPTQYAKGFVVGESIISNAWPHRRQAVILKFDIKDFFPSINFYRVRGMLMAWPFTFTSDIATVYAQICCMDNGPIAQGAVTSPYVSNMICRRLDKHLANLAYKHRMVFTRYADDITFSSSSKSLAIKKIQQEIIELIQNEKFTVNKEKLKVLFPSQRQMVTGIVVNDGVNVPRKYIKQVRAILYKCEMFGVASVVGDHLDYVKPGQPCAPIHKEYVPNDEGFELFEGFPVLTPKYKRNGVDKEISFYKVTLIFLSHLRGRILYIGQVAKANYNSIWEVPIDSGSPPGGFSERTAYLKRYKIYRDLLDRYNTIIKYEDYGKELAIKVKSLKSQYMDSEEIKYFMGRSIEKIRNDVSEKAKTEARFFYSLSSKMNESDIREKLELLLNRFPPDIETTRSVLQSAQDTGSMLMMLLHNETIEAIKFEQYFQQYIKTKEKLPFRLEKELTKLMKEASYVFQRENVDEYNFAQDNQFNSDHAMPFKNNSRFVLNPRKSSGGTDAYKMITKILRNPVIRKNMKEKGVKIPIPKDEIAWRIDLYTHVHSVEWALRRIIESMVVNSSKTQIHISLKSDKKGFTTILINNDDTSAISNSPTRETLAHGKLKKAMEYLNGLAEYSIEANFDDLGWLSLDMYTNKTQEIEPQAGFTHRIVF